MPEAMDAVAYLDRAMARIRDGGLEKHRLHSWHGDAWCIMGALTVSDGADLRRLDVEDLGMIAETDPVRSALMALFVTAPGDRRHVVRTDLGPSVGPLWNFCARINNLESTTPDDVLDWIGRARDHVAATVPS
jgi:hypothetical protein